MEFGKVTSLPALDRISFQLPYEDKRSTEYLISLKNKDNSHLQSQLKVYLGCPIWGKKEWVGKVYPPHTSQKDYLKYYSQQFNTIELNTTFYRIPEISTVEKWRETVPRHFKFCPKVFQGISQFENLYEIPELTQRFTQSILHFEDRLGTSFMQLPPSFGPEKLIILKRFFKLLPKGFQLALELRHPRWFHRGHLIPPIFELLSEFEISTVITDVAGRRDVLHSTLTTPTSLIRFVGNALHASDSPRIESWVQRFATWIQNGVKTIYFFVHQPEEIGTLETIDSFVAQMNKHPEVQLKSWDSALANPQIGLFG